MNLSTLDWTIIFGFFAVSLAVGLFAAKTSGRSSSDFFLSGRNMPWWLLGISMVATTFSADTPNLVTGLVRESGVAGNWGWWAFLLTGMLTVFVFARLWRRSMVLTDVEFYELRYSGKMASFLRGFRALYLGLIFNVLVMGAVSLAAVKFGEILLGIPGWQTLLVAGVITLIYSTLGGFKAIILTDFVQFLMAMIGSVWACIYIVNLPEIGGLSNLLAHENVIDKIQIFPDMSNPNVWVPVLLVPLAVQWWASYYPGAEPGGGGYIAQRMFSAKNETNAVGATLLFNFAHYALRPWPWILIALVSLIIFPMQLEKINNKSGIIISQEAKDSLDKNSTQIMYEKFLENIDLNIANSKINKKKEDYARLKNVAIQNSESYEIKSLSYIFGEKNFDHSIKEWKPQNYWSDPLYDESLVYIQIANPGLPIDKIGHDVAYPAMLTKLPSGLLGLLAASIFAAFMSTMSTQLNLGASYLVNDFYKRFLKPEASEKEQVLAARLFTVLSAFLGLGLGLILTDATQAFNLLLLLGAGTGLIYILRWFWWRINATTEVVAMVASLIIASVLTFTDNSLESWEKIVLGALLTTLTWVAATYLTPPTNDDTLINFYQKIKPGGNGWNVIIQKAKSQNIILEKSNENLPIQFLSFIVGTITVYAALIATGLWIYGTTIPAAVCTVIAIGGTYFLIKTWGNLTRD